MARLRARRRRGANLQRRPQAQRRRPINPMGMRRAALQLFGRPRARRLRCAAHGRPGARAAATRVGRRRAGRCRAAAVTPSRPGLRGERGAPRHATRGPCQRGGRGRPSGCHRRRHQAGTKQAPPRRQPRSRAAAAGPGAQAGRAAGVGVARRGVGVMRMHARAAALVAVANRAARARQPAAAAVPRGQPVFGFAGGNLRVVQVRAVRKHLARSKWRRGEARARCARVRWRRRRLVAAHRPAQRVCPGLRRGVAVPAVRGGVAWRRMGRDLHRIRGGSRSGGEAGGVRARRGGGGSARPRATLSRRRHAGHGVQ